MIDNIKSKINQYQSKINQYQNPATYSQYQQATQALREAQGKLDQLRSDVDIQIKTLETKITQDLDNLILTAFTTAVNAVPDSVWQTVGQVLDIENKAENILQALVQPLEITVKFDFDPGIHDAPENSPIFLAHRRNKNNQDLAPLRFTSLPLN